MATTKAKKWSDYLWIVSATYFTLGFFNIVFAWLGVICFLIPLVMALSGWGKGYCNNYCGRGQLFLQIGNTLGWSRRKVAPRWLSSKWFRNGFLVFFLFIVGVVLTVVYRPRTWCVFCPMGNMTQMICKIKKGGN